MSNKLVRFLKATGKSTLRIAGTLGSCAGGAFVGKTVYEHIENPTVAAVAGCGTAVAGTVVVNGIIDSCSSKESVSNADDRLLERLEKVEEVNKRMSKDMITLVQNTTSNNELVEKHSEVIADVVKAQVAQKKTLDSMNKLIVEMQEILDTVTDTVFDEKITSIAEEQTQEELEKEYHVKPDKNEKNRKSGKRR